jgi:hypothetical protein
MTRYFKDPNTNLTSNNTRKQGRKLLAVEKVYQDSDEILQVNERLTQLKKESDLISRRDVSDSDLSSSNAAEIVRITSKLNKLKRDHLLKSVVNDNTKDYSFEFQLTVLRELLTTLFDRQPNINFSEKEVKQVFNNFKNSKNDDLYDYSLRFVLLNYLANKNEIKFPNLLEKPRDVTNFEDLVLETVLPSIRKNLQRYNSDSTTSSSTRLATDIKALISIYLYTWYDCKTDKNIESDIFVLFEILENTNDDVILQASLAAVTLLTFYSENWFDTIESSALKLFEIFQNRSLQDKLLIGQALAFLYNIYDYSEQHADLATSKENSVPYIFNIPTIDNGQLDYELSQTATNLRLSTETDYTDDHFLEKIKSSIDASLVLANASEPHPSEYGRYEQHVLEITKFLDLGLRRDGINYSWLQVLVYPTLIWLFESHLNIELQRSTLVSNVYYSLSAYSVFWSRTNQRLKLFRYTHIHDPKFVKCAHLDQARRDSNSDDDYERHSGKHRHRRKSPKATKKFSKHEKNLLSFA